MKIKPINIYSWLLVYIYGKEEYKIQQSLIKVQIITEGKLMAHNVYYRLSTIYISYVNSKVLT